MKNSKEFEKAIDEVFGTLLESEIDDLEDIDVTPEKEGDGELEHDKGIELDNDEIDQPLEGPAGEEGYAGEPIHDKPEGYSVQNAYDQLGGILKQWMNLQGQYPEGSDNKEKFIELGERLKEIQLVMKRDFMEEQGDMGGVEDFGEMGDEIDRGMDLEVEELI